LSTPAAPASTARRRLARAVAVVVLVGGSAGCQASAGPGAEPPDPAETSSVPAASTAEPGPVPSARVGRPGRTERVTFRPEAVVLPGGAQAPVQPAETVDGRLRVPENVQHVGWWDGSAYAGDPFGRTVIAGHVDATDGGAGFFARLRQTKVGDVVTLRAGSHRLRYKITAVQTVARQALATDSQAFDQSGPHRLVLITCTGDYRPDRGGYESNLVVVGTPLGRAV
jgi:LPXTG-site transpeptidase (sortase) family protein